MKIHSLPRSSRTSGFSLIEVMLFATILSIVFVIAAAYVVNLLRVMKINEHRILATFYAEELREWLKSEREADWDAFAEKATPEGVTYCFNSNLEINDTIASIGTNAPPAKFVSVNQASCGYTGIGGQNPAIFKREVKLTKENKTPPTWVNAEITVMWMENGIENIVPINARFSIFE